MKTVHIRTLKSGWCDRDEILLHAAFQILADYMEKEKPGRIIDWSHDAPHRKAWREINDLYLWWKKKRPARKGPFELRKIAHPPLKFEKTEDGHSRLMRHDPKKYAAYDRALRQMTRVEARWHAEDQKNLHRLIDIRECLWT
jgi:hypothetical protein